VLEGATLGGQIIAKVLQERLGLTNQYGARYFNGYGPNTMKMWVAFCHQLNQVNALQERQVVASASMTYMTLIDWMNQEWISNEN
jgi:heme oxygenase